MHNTPRFIVAFGALAAFIVGLLYVSITAQASAEAGADSALVDKAAPVFGIKIYPGYRDWPLVSVAHEAGKLNDIRAILANDKGILAYRSHSASFPDGTVLARLAWNYVPSDENNKAFGQEQSFIAGDAPAWHLQFMVKDSKKYASTGGWGFAQFDKDGNPAPEAPLHGCFACHQAVSGRDFVFTQYAP